MISILIFLFALIANAFPHLRLQTEVTYCTMPQIQKRVFSTVDVFGNSTDVFYLFVSNENGLAVEIQVPFALEKKGLEFHCIVDNCCFELKSKKDSGLPFYVFQPPISIVNKANATFT